MKTFLKYRINPSIKNGTVFLDVRVVYTQTK